METRSQGISRHVAAYLRATGISMPTFSQDVVDRYHAQVGPMHRVIRFQTEGDTFNCMKLNAQTLTRFLEGDIRFPDDLEEAVAAALPPEARDALLTDLAGRYGLLAVPMLQSNKPAAKAQFVGRLAKVAGKAIADLGELLDEGEQPSLEHQAHAAKAVTELDELIAWATGIRKALDGHANAGRAVRQVR